MASLNVIMNSDEDQQNTPRVNKRDKDPGTPASGSRGHDPSFNSAHSSHVTRSGQLHNHERNQSPGATPQGKRRAASSRLNKTSTAAPASRASASRRRSTASNDSMDHTGYGSAASSSSMGGVGGGGMNPNQPSRPMPNQPQGGDIPIKLTPITGRVSRAKKGVPVHTCELCKKTFTRAEHLRRHQLSHQTPAFACTYPGCDRTFHRPDLLTRHQQRHEQEGDRVSGRGGGDSSRRTSSASASASIEERMPKLGLSGLQAPSGFTSNPAGLGGPSTPSTSASDMPSTPNLQHSSAFQQVSSPGSGSIPAMSPPMGGGGEGYAPSGSRPSQGYSSYTLSPIPVIQHPHSTMGSSPPNFHAVDYQQPRNPPGIPLFVVTQNLTSASIPIGDGPPELCHTQDASPWTSASDSTYSTPSDMSRTHRYWMSRHRSPTATDWQANNLLSPYPTSGQRDLHSPSGGLETMPAPYFTNTFPPSPHMGSTQYHTYSSMLDVPIATGFGDDQTQHSLMDGSSQGMHTQHGAATTSLRSPTPPLAMAMSTQSGEALVMPAMALPDRMGMLSGRQKEMVMGNVGVSVGMGGGIDMLGVSGGASPGWGGGSPGGLLGSPGYGGMTCVAGVTMVVPLQRPVRNAIPGYLEIYWTRFHDLYPIVHRSSVEGAGEDVLRCAMAAIATQFLDSKEDRTRGNLLHEFAWQESKRYPQWNLQIMQAILLCELFARFRGRKAVTRPSKQFENLYSRVLDQYPTIFDNAPAHMSMTKEDRWHTWLDAEARRRLLTACFIVDAQTSIYHEQPRTRDFDLSNPGTVPPIPLTASSAALWAAGTADEWASLLDADVASGAVQFLPHPDSLTADDIQCRPRFDQMAILAAETLRLPKRSALNTSGQADSSSSASPLGGGPTDRHYHSKDESRDPVVAAAAHAAEERIAQLFPTDPVANTYLALYRTPLHDLLAVSGDSWVFSQKVVQQTSFQEHQKRLKLWAEQHMHAAVRAAGGGGNTGGNNPFAGLDGTSAAKATVFAARALVAFLTQPGPGDISDYWGLYASALVCWAFGHRAMRGDGAKAGGSNSRASDEEALQWLQLVSDMRPEEALRVRGRREAGGVVGLVRRRLEADCVGGRSRLFVDAVGVLRKLDEGMNWKWF